MKNYPAPDTLVDFNTAVDDAEFLANCLAEAQALLLGHRCHRQGSNHSYTNAIDESPTRRRLQRCYRRYQER